jgi:hypothetical protein
MIKPYTPPPSGCPNCGGDLIGDGYTSVIHCEYADDDEYAYAAPDEGPFLCNFEDQE